MEYLQQEQTATATTDGYPIVRNQIRRGPIENPVIKRDSLGEKLSRIEDKLDFAEKKQETKKRKKRWRFPFKWRMTMNKSLRSQARESVLFFYLNIKGELEPPKLLPIYSGNTVIYKNVPYEIDPRAFWTLRIGRKFYKLMIYKQIDRRPVSNLNYTEIKKRGDATDSDEVLIKATLRATQHSISKQQIGKGAIVIGILVLVGGAIWFFTQG